MPSERHINRQVQWRTELQKYGCNVSLERTVRIKGARVVVDVYAEVEGKAFLIEIGNIDDERKTALMQYYAQEKPNIEFLHESYGENKIPRVLESLASYRNSAEYKAMRERKETLRKYNVKKIQLKSVRKPMWSDLTLKLFLAVPTILIFVLSAYLPFGLIFNLYPRSWNKMNFQGSFIFSLVLDIIWFGILWFMWSHRNTFEHTKYDKRLEQELKTLEEETVKDVKVLFPDEITELLTFEDKGDHIKVSPRKFLGAEDFAKIASIIREAQGEYVSQGRDSHFKVPKH